VQAEKVLTPQGSSAKLFIVRDANPAIARCQLAADCNGPAIFVGIQSAFGIREDLALFQRRPNSTTIAIPVSKVSPLALAYAFLGKNFTEQGK
jgi:hypothetical protein